MSDEERDQPYRVGHGRPPPEHRFAKGTSGNPRGRPRKLRELEGEARRAQDLFLAEAKRLITVKEGGRAVQMPAFQAVVKSTLVAALKGSPTAQKAIIQMTLSIEAERERNRFSAYLLALELKNQLERLRDSVVASGGDEWQMSAHPSDIEIDPSGAVRSFILLTREQRQARRQVLEEVAAAEATLRRLQATIAEDGDDPILALAREIAELKIRMANESLPKRFRSSALEELGYDQPSPTVAEFLAGGSAGRQGNYPRARS